MYDLELDKEPIEAAVYMALGAASVCWTELSPNGIFESEKVETIGEQLIKRIKDEIVYQKP